MKILFSTALLIAGLLVFVALGSAFKVTLGRYIVLFLLVFIGVSFVISLVASLLFIFTVRPDTSHKE
jgi:hypothetical protein